ncbi:Zinc finger MYM-type protein 6 [Holothuria leucospilota]|uniref:Zinc finger MYM-type protein 6 n=1 Tax=Holothuria leucospilota TaxID=206669 RepID=A0A9Q0YAA2_HOLLE|nr:Zinc finger MYM-type protein 6 [Holothuria leucospilota]
MFPDSNIAKQYACGRTKTWHVVQSLAENDAKDLATRMKHHPYSLATDGSTDMESIKLYPVLVKSFDPVLGQMVCELLSMKQSTERSTGENIFNLLNNELTSWSIPWSNCVSFGTDNASVMLGKHKGVATLIKQKNPNTYIAGCPCHLMHLAAQKGGGGGKCLQYQIDELLVDIWYYIDESQLRHQAIINIQQEHGIEVRKILKHVSTRWLSLGKAIKRLLENWDVLLNFFKSESALHTRKRKAPSSDLPGKTAKKSKTEIPNKNIVPFTKTKSKPIATSSTKLAPPPPPTKSKTASCIKNKSVPSTSRGPAKDITIPSATKQFDLNRYLFDQQELAKKHSRAKKKESLLSQKSVKKSTASVTGSETQRPHKTTLIYRQLNDPNCKLYAMFLNAILPFFDHANEVLQKDEPQIHLVHDVLIDQLSSILSRFLKPDVILAAKDITMLDLSNEDNHKADSDIQIGHECKVFLTQNKDMLFVKAFYTCVKKFYIAACENMITHYPYNDELLLNVKIVNIADRTQVKFSSVEYFVKRFDLVPKESMDQLESEFNQYQDRQKHCG